MAFKNASDTFRSKGGLDTDFTATQPARLTIISKNLTQAHALLKQQRAKNPKSFI